LRISREILNRPTMLKALIVLKDSGPMTLSALSRALGTNKRRLKVYLEFLVSEGWRSAAGLGLTTSRRRSSYSGE